MAKKLRIYAYTHAGKDTETWVRRTGQTLTTGTGLIKVGQTTKATARTRIKQQLGTAYPNLDGVTILLDEPALTDRGEEFTDHQVHAALVAAGIRRPGGEWFEATLDDVKAAIHQVRTGAPFDPTRTDTFQMRPEQQSAVDATVAYFRTHTTTGRAPKFLWNAKMRFGKTFTTYQLAKQMGWRKILVLTYKPAVQSSWRDDLTHHVDFTGWQFIDRDTDPTLRDQAADRTEPQVWFASFQDLTGRTNTGDVKDHNEVLHLIEWDAIVIDEYHFGAWRQTARDLYDPTEQDAADDENPDAPVTSEDLGLTASHYLYLSGTPFRAITNGEFTEDQIFNWTYTHEQAAKTTWDTTDGPNPYTALPGMRMYTYRMGAQADDWANDGEFNEFSLAKYFEAHRTDQPGKDTLPGAYEFTNKQQVLDFLNMIRGKLSGQMKTQVLTAGKKAPFPYDSPDFAHAVRHTLWYLSSVASCYAMRDLLTQHPYFSSYEIVVAAGTAAGQGADAKPPVDLAIGTAEKNHTSGTITLSCGKLLTGVTVPEWGAIFMLTSLRSPETYFQAAFRVQSPWTTRNTEGHVDIHKDTCYVFEFDPNRALGLVAEYGVRFSAAEDVTPSTAIDRLLHHLPIFAFDDGEMRELDTTAVMEWATAGIGSAALAARWNSPLLVEVNEHTLAAVLEEPGLLDKLAQVEDFRALVNHAAQVVTSTRNLKAAKRAQGGNLDPAQRKQQSEAQKLRKEIREKLQKFLAKIPVFMYVTDFREEALKHVIESLDSDLFERVTGLTVEDFRTLSRLGLFSKQHMDAAIYQFRAFEVQSLHYIDVDGESSSHDTYVGLWESTIAVNDLAVDPH